MKVRISISNLPGQPIVETREADSTLEAVREVINSAEMEDIWNRREQRNGGWLIVSAMPAPVRENTDATQRVPTSDKEALKLS
jgi:hypothetical protein